MKGPSAQFFPDDLMAAVKERFLHVDHDVDGSPRLFLDNAGGSLRLKAAVDAFAFIDGLPDCPERIHKRAKYLHQIEEQGELDIRILTNAQSGSLMTSLTASSAMFDLVRAVMEAVPGRNAVTTILEHPSAFDAMQMYARHTDKELRIASSNPRTGGVDIEEIVSMVDADTVLLNVMYASNISGAKFDLERIVTKARQKNPNIYILVDAVQHAPHGVIDLARTPVDGLTFAPYKFYGCRGFGVAWLSPRLAELPHHKLAGRPQGFWQLGSAAPAHFAALSAVVDYVCWIGTQIEIGQSRREQFVRGMLRIEEHERALLSALLDGCGNEAGLRQLNGVQVFWDHDDLHRRDLILGIGFDRLEPTAAVREYEKRGVITYERVASSIYSGRMLGSLGVTGAVRVSPLHCHSPSDIERFLTVTREISKL
jgi:selenocysteine lyase/cysteine desulfurase